MIDYLIQSLLHFRLELFVIRPAHFLANHFYYWLLLSFACLDGGLRGLAADILSIGVLPSGRASLDLLHLLVRQFVDTLFISHEHLSWNLGFLHSI